METRSADFAGSWYPGKETECRRAIEELSEEAMPCSAGAGGIGGIVPHAGWFYSGRIACSVIKCLAREEDARTCLIFGRHLHSGSYNYVMKEGAWATPLGELEVDAEIAEKIIGEFDFTVETPRHYEQDNTIELQLPFLKYFLPEIRIVPFGLPPSLSTLDIARRAAEISQELNRKTIVLGSTDLTHYGHNYGYTPKGAGRHAVEWVKNVSDKRIVDLMLRMDGKEVIQEALSGHNACCSGAAAAAIVAAGVLGANKAELMIYSTSYDIRPDTSFVGYAGIVFRS